jgi:hypothetical protein
LSRLLKIDEKIRYVALRGDGMDNVYSIKILPTKTDSGRE